MLASYPTSPRTTEYHTSRLSKRNGLLKKLIWAYFLLLIFEGALRKWFLPGLSTPLLLIRDPLAIWIIVLAIRDGCFPSSLYVFFMALIGITSIYTAFFLGHGNFLVAVYGARTFLFHFPLIFVIGRIFNQEDILEIGRALLWISILMTLLIALQFYSPQSALVNRGIAGDASGTGFGGVNGFFRPPGTFSFTNGTSLFYGFLACFICYFWLNPKQINKLVLISSTICLLIAVPLSLSRGLFFSVAVTLLFALIAISRKPKYFGRMVFSLIGGTATIFILGHVSFFHTATEALTTRFTLGNISEGGLGGVLIDRYLGGLIGALTNSSNEPFFGYGIGMGTNVGSIMMTGKSIFLISEGEWGRIIGELGPVMGVAVILVRLGLSSKLAILSYQKLIKGDLLPWMLLSFGLLTIPQGGWAQPTSLGFCTIIGGLILAAVKRSRLKKSIKLHSNT